METNDTEEPVEVNKNKSAISNTCLSPERSPSL